MTVIDTYLRRLTLSRKTSIRITGSKIWNSNPLRIKQAQNIHLFKKSLRDH